MGAITFHTSKTPHFCFYVYLTIITTLPLKFFHPQAATRRLKFILDLTEINSGQFLFLILCLIRMDIICFFTSFLEYPRHKETFLFIQIIDKSLVSARSKQIILY